jgi:hypothetical protein
MDTVRSTGLQLEHRHNDGSWSLLEREPHDTAEHDPERSWLSGILFRCRSCDEQVRVTSGRDPDPADSAAR